MEDSFSWHHYFSTWRTYKRDVTSYGHDPEKIIKELLPKLGDPRLVLDIGSGPGHYLHLFKDTVSLDYSRERLSGNPGKKVLGLAENLPFKDNSFDLALAIAIMEYVDAKKVMTEMKRVSDLLIFTFEKIVDMDEHQIYESGPVSSRIWKESEMRGIVGPDFDIEIMEFPGYGPYNWVTFICRRKASSL